MDTTQTPKGKQALYRACCLHFFTLGWLVLTTSAVLRTLIAENQWSNSLGGLLISLQALGSLLASLLVGFALRAWGRRRTLCVGVVCGIVGFAGMTLVRTPALMYPLILLTGLYWGMNNALMNLLVSEAYEGSVARINTLHACFAAGAVAAPLAVSALLAAGVSWRVPVCAVAALMAVGLWVSLRVPMPEPGSQRAHTPGGAAVFWRKGAFYLAASAFFTYVGVETAVSAWIAPFLGAENAFFATVRPEAVISLMWLLIIAGRLTVASLAGRLHRARLLVMEAAGFLLGLVGLILLVRLTIPALVCVAFMGLSMSAIYGTLIANNAELMASSPLVPGLIFAGGGLGATLVPLAAGVFADLGGIRLGMGMLAALLVVLLAQALAYARRRAA